MHEELPAGGDKTEEEKEEEDEEERDRERERFFSFSTFVLFERGGHSQDMEETVEVSESFFVPINPMENRFFKSFKKNFSQSFEKGKTKLYPV